ncbi:2-amino-4-hydroxy-6-hydroxymethyldihydropteridin epyrophosphokinase [Russula earlei]|uniref:2-amino-4-hydroxy-6-hydroxymethyldihydropteridin epyrophosphokinase n=1 Tax=Russula earlei TaxID=71964 RepID=A0ACC0TVL1_9AGAM|nr:2-amino-4-hydroxy-6-hydroxymethyldihydropteridin epyrophosphokinase [Russula earlei]
MYTAYLLTGSNLGNKLQYLAQAKQLIGAYGEVISESSIYETAAWGLEAQPSFLNQALALVTSLEPETLMTRLLEEEEKMGRRRTIQFGPRIIDIDILLADDMIINTPVLTLPHPAIPARRFVLVPLDEIAPTLLHPVEKKTIHQLLLDCTDTLDVQKFTTNAG